MIRPSTRCDSLWIVVCLLQNAIFLDCCIVGQAFSPRAVSFHSLLSTKKLTNKVAALVNPVETIANEDDVFENNEEPQTSKEKFNWFKAWYPIITVEILDEEKPHKTQLLGMDIVIWKDASIEGRAVFASKKKRSKKAKRVGGQWRVFLDECPHRKVPLSEGRVEDDGSLLCSYHAWRFNGNGTLISVPQLLGDEAAMERVKANPRSNCNSFPAQVVDGILWVWPETGSDARLESSLTPTQHYRLPANIDKSRIRWGPWYYKVQPYGADFFIENVVDPAHVPVSHHNIVGSRYGDQKLKITKKSPMSKNGFALSAWRSYGPFPANTTFKAPAVVVVEQQFNPEGAMQIIELYASPSVPGFCNHVSRQTFIKAKDGTLPAFLKKFSLPVPKWLHHLMSPAFHNQDAQFLHHQERYLAGTGSYTSAIDNSSLTGYDYNKAVLPVNTDYGVITFRNWLRNIAGGRIPYRHHHPMPPANNDIVSDIWNSHTKYCQYCQVALARLKKARFAAFSLATVIGVARPYNKATTMLGVIVSASTGLILNKLMGYFYRHEFSHARND